ALPATQRAGDALLREKKFDLVYFSSTQWPVHLAGPHWKRRSGVPFAMDYQDPWVNDYYRRHPEVTPPGGRLRYAAADALSRWTEPRVLRECSGYTLVSEAYPADLTRRYPWSATIPHVVMPFPGSERDFERVRSEDVRQTQFDPQDGKRHWVYVGRGGKDMETAAHALFRAVAEHARTSSGFRGQVVMHFIGTSYAPAGTGRATISPIAAEYGISEMVREHPDRIPYSETLRCLLDATSIIALGSNDASYTASKIYPCLLAGKPLLVVCHEQSGVVRLMEEVGGGVCVTFGGERSGDAAENIRSRWLECGAYKTTTSLNRARFERYMERASAAALARFWGAVGPLDYGTTGLRDDGTERPRVADCWLTGPLDYGTTSPRDCVTLVDTKRNTIRRERDV
ncbi:MAG: hypothetical protein ACKOD5_08220, partial [Chthoniobacterales bacterium]